MVDAVPLYVRLFPLQEVADDAVRAEIARLQAQWAADYPHQMMPPILVPLLSSDAQAGVGSGKRAFDVLNLTGGTPAFFMRPLPQVKEYMGIIVHPEALEKMTAQELSLFVAHEAGHYYLKHNTASMNGDDIKRMECGADQFASHYIKNADALLLSAAYRWFSRSRAGRDPQLNQLDFINWLGRETATHPSPANRIRLLQSEALAAMTPGSISFRPDCQPESATEVLPAPSFFRGLHLQLQPAR